MAGIKGYEFTYDINNKGQIFNKKNGSEVVPVNGIVWLWKDGRRQPKRYKDLLMQIDRPINQIDKDGNVKTYNSIKDISKTELNTTSVKKCLDGKTKTHKGFKFEYA